MVFDEYGKKKQQYEEKTAGVDKLFSYLFTKWKKILVPKYNPIVSVFLMFYNV